ncbi:hypothetical protein [Halobacteriovorax sp. HLS]|uniref:hypothetical protein n=1 Tax=Halobacteriovorax sp. HLS TaxID=2234000 RepID=UPI000FDC9EFD|nr:hypothetical protein [Halobacteriovorax sp. HLS]
MYVDQEFEKIILKLKNEQRPLIKYSPEEFAKINDHWTSLLEKRSYSELYKVFCILDNTQNYSDLFSENIYKTFLEVNEPQTIIYNLSAASKHIISYNHKLGQRVPFDLITKLKELLTHKDPEVLEWTLRTIEQLGSQAIFLKDDIINARPGMLAIFDKHKKASKQIIEMLEKRWSPRE